MCIRGLSNLVLVSHVLMDRGRSNSLCTHAFKDHQTCLITFSCTNGSINDGWCCPTKKEIKALCSCLYRVTAEDWVKQFPEDPYISQGALFYQVCNHSIDYVVDIKRSYSLHKRLLNERRESLNEENTRRLMYDAILQCFHWTSLLAYFCAHMSIVYLGCNYLAYCCFISFCLSRSWHYRKQRMVF